MRRVWSGSEIGEDAQSTAGSWRSPRLPGLEQIYGTRESLHAVMGGEQFVFLKCILQFLEVPESRPIETVPQGPLPSRPDTSKQVMSLLFKL